MVKLGILICKCPRTERKQSVTPTTKKLVNVAETLGKKFSYDSVRDKEKVSVEKEGKINPTHLIPGVSG